MDGKFQKKLLKAIKKGKCKKVIKMCCESSCSPEMMEEVILRAMYGNRLDKDPCE